MDDAPSSPSTEAKDLESAPFEAIRFTPEQQRHVQLMRGIARSITASTRDNFVLKGGTALLLAYGLPRYSEDLDFDGKRSSVDLTAGIHAGAQQVGVTVDQLTTKKNTATTRRHMLHHGGDTAAPLKIEVSYRQSEDIDEADVTTVDGIRVYKLEKLAELKVAAMVNRTAARDIFDVAFLLDRYPAAISDASLREVEGLIDRLGLDDLEAIMRHDRILQSHDLAHVAVALVDGVAALRSQR